MKACHDTENCFEIYENMIKMYKMDRLESEKFR